MLYHTGESQHTQNVQINKVTDENEKCVFHFMEKTEGTFWPPNIKLSSLHLTATTEKLLLGHVQQCH